jgi:hypothetical protein
LKISGCGGGKNAQAFLLCFAIHLIRKTPASLSACVFGSVSINPGSYAIKPTTYVNIEDPINPATLWPIRSEII